MKSILIISEVFWPENFAINDLVNQLKDDGYKVDIMTQHPSYPFGTVYDGYDNSEFYCEEWNGSIIYRFKVIEGYRDSTIKKLINYLYFVYKGNKIARKITAKYDAVFVSQSGPLSVALPAIAYASKNRCRLYLWVQDIWPDAVYAYGFKKNFILTTILNGFIKHVYSKFDKIFVSSYNFRNNILKYVPYKEVHYMPNWLIESDESKTSIQFDSNTFNITFAGNISLYQNLENVINGFKLANIQNCKIHIIGDGSKLSDLKQLVELENIDNIEFYGRRPATEILDILSNSDALLLPLISDEGIQKTEPFKIQSYLKSGKPILGIINGSGKEIIEENKLGLCSNPDNIEDIACSFKNIIEFARENSAEVAINAANLMNTRFNRRMIYENLVCEIDETK